jgi:hypothetical protein
MPSNRGAGISKHALASDWVESEVTRALDEERVRKQLLDRV